MKEEKIVVKDLGIVLKPGKVGEYQTVIPNLCTWLKKKKINPVFYSSEKERLDSIFKKKGKCYTLASREEVSHTDLIISLGGDGTLLGICRDLNTKSTPIMGVNMGKLGFITEFSLSNFYEDLNYFMKYGFPIVNVNTFKVEIRDKKGKKSQHFFINDVVLSKTDISRMFELSVDANGEHVSNIPGDGLIVSSPVGSTAYSLAAGGPILHPEVAGLVLTPICPHTLTHRPIVIPDKIEVTIRPQKNTKNLNLTLDGQIVVPLHDSSLVTVRKSTSKKIRFVKNPNRTYFYTLKEKLIHGRR